MNRSILMILSALLAVQASESFLGEDSMTELGRSGYSYSYRPTTTYTYTYTTYKPSYYTPTYYTTYYGGYGYHSTTVVAGGGGGVIAFIGICFIIVIIMCCVCAASNGTTVVHDDHHDGFVQTTTVTTVVPGGNGPMAVQVPPPFPPAFPGGPTQPWCKNGHQMTWLQGNVYSQEGDDGPVCDSCNVKFNYMMTYAHCYTCSDDLCFNCAPGQVR